MCVDLRVMWESKVESCLFPTVSTYAHLEKNRINSVYRQDDVIIVSKEQNVNAELIQQAVYVKESCRF